MRNQTMEYFSTSFKPDVAKPTRPRLSKTTQTTLTRYKMKYPVDRLEYVAWKEGRELQEKPNK